MIEMNNRVETATKKKSRKIVSFQVIHMPSKEEPKQEVCIGYALTEQGDLYEFINGSWKKLPPIID